METTRVGFWPWIDLQDTVDWDKWLIHSSPGKTQHVSFEWSNNSDTIDVKVDGSIFDWKSSFKMLGPSFSSELDWYSYIVSFAKTAVKKMGVLGSFFLLRLLFITINLLYNLVQNTVVIFWLVLPAATWIF